MYTHISKFQEWAAVSEDDDRASCPRSRLSSGKHRIMRIYKCNNKV